MQPHSLPPLDSQKCLSHQKILTGEKAGLQKTRLHFWREQLGRWPEYPLQDFHFQSQFVSVPECASSSAPALGCMGLAAELSGVKVPLALQCSCRPEAEHSSAAEVGGWCGA
eukprot:jgi/Ulvmu1/8214/UM041_0023.1